MSKESAEYLRRAEDAPDEPEKIWAEVQDVAEDVDWDICRMLDEDTDN